MNTQTKLSELDATTLALWKAREQLFVQERDVFLCDLLARYGNPGEALTVDKDGVTLVRAAGTPDGAGHERAGSLPEKGRRGPAARGGRRRDHSRR